RIDFLMPGQRPRRQLHCLDSTRGKYAATSWAWTTQASRSSQPTASCPDTVLRSNQGNHMPLLFDVKDHIATISLNRPEAMNSIDPETRGELHAAWRRIKEDDAIRVAILTGAGEKSFCTGSVLKKT